MRPILLAVVMLAWTSVAHGGGLLIPVEPDLPPLALLNHRVKVTIDEQVAVTSIEQTFRNHTDRQLEATYVFPVPEGASVTAFATYVNGQRVQGELLKNDKAEQLYTSIVRQTKNPALLSYVGSDLLSLKVFPIPPHGDGKVAIRFTAICPKEQEIVEYTYPLSTDRQPVSTLEEFRLDLTLRSQQVLSGIYSPTHEISVQQHNDHEAAVHFQQLGAELARDFRLYYTTSGSDIGLTTLQHRPVSTEDGYVMLLISPRAELSQDQKVPRDIVFVADTSGSMIYENKLDHAKQALKHCLSGLAADDRFALITFGTTVNRYRDELLPATSEQLADAQTWVDKLYASGGTAIHQALTTALALRSEDPGRMFTIVFFTDGQPTVGEMNVDRILADVAKQDTGNTRIFSFGIGHDLNAVLLDRLAEQTRAISRYVQPGENFESQVASFFEKIHHPVLSDLKLTTSGDTRLVEVYPPRLPDLFHGEQLVVLARYENSGSTQLVLEGSVGVHKKQFTYDVEFHPHAAGKPFVEELWARRKVGYLLDQIRLNGEQQELVDEVVRLSEAYGITTPYTSYLIMPDVPVQVAASELGLQGGLGAASQAGGRNEASGSAGEGVRLADLARGLSEEKELAEQRGAYQDRYFAQLDPKASGANGPVRALGREQQQVLEKLETAKGLKRTLDLAQSNYRQGEYQKNHVDELGVKLALCTNQLKQECQLRPSAVRRIGSSRCLELGGIWIDDSFTAQTPMLAIRAQSDAYFELLKRHPEVKNVYELGNQVVWVAPSGTALVIDTADGREQLTEAEMDNLFESAN